MSNTFGNRLKTLRTEAGLTGTELGTQYNLTKSAISSYERRFREPSQELLKQLSKQFGVSIDYLVGNSDIRNPIEDTKNEVHGFTIDLVKQLLESGIIDDPDNIDSNIVDMVISALKADLKNKEDKKKD